MQTSSHKCFTGHTVCTMAATWVTKQAQFKAWPIKFIRQPSRTCSESDERKGGKFHRQLSGELSETIFYFRGLPISLLWFYEWGRVYWGKINN